MPTNPFSWLYYQTAIEAKAPRAPLIQSLAVLLSTFLRFLYKVIDISFHFPISLYHAWASILRHDANAALVTDYSVHRNGSHSY